MEKEKPEFGMPVGTGRKVGRAVSVRMYWDFKNKAASYAIKKKVCVTS